MTITVSYGLDCVRIRARRLKPAIRFYSSLFGCPVVKELYNGEIYAFRMSDGRQLLLDDIRAADVREPLAKPAAVLAVKDLSAAYEHTKQFPFAYVSSIEKGVNYLYFTCRDTDHNVFAVSDRTYPYSGTVQITNASPIEARMSALVLPVSDVRKAGAFYTEWLAAPDPVEVLTDNGCYRTRLQDGTPVELVPDSGQEDRAFPLLRLYSEDLPASYKHLKAMQAELCTRPEEAEQGRPILFKDYDGRLIAVECSATV
ncbi:MAG: Glyoxalase-like domain [Paenibacillus sp.]|nr:Glyoxalase-like domain [Paenibacillus sp.]